MNKKVFAPAGCTPRTSEDFSLVGLILAAILLLLPLSSAAEDKTPALDTLQSTHWDEWHERSEKLRRIDQESFNRELKAIGESKPTLPEWSKNAGLEPYQPAEFYRSDEGRRIADIILSFQTPSGGWSKRVDMTRRPRASGETFGPHKKGYQPTFDNQATSIQMQYLARAFTATREPRYRNGFLRGLELILKAQMPNGGWPQSFPLDGGYHDLVTYNDKSTVGLLELLLAIDQEKTAFTFVPPAQKARASEALQRGIESILLAQQHSNGTKSIWAAQHHPATLKPAAARAFEPAALATQESAEILLFLMDLPNPSEAVIEAIEGAMSWFRAQRIIGYRWDSPDELVPDPTAKPLWARFYDPMTLQPVFGDRDGKVHTSLSTVSLERRQGYGWYSTTPAKLEKRYRQWKETLARGKPKRGGE